MLSRASWSSCRRGGGRERREERGEERGERRERRERREEKRISETGEVHKRSIYTDQRTVSITGNFVHHLEN